MTQRDLNRAVARATGESVERIERMGFGPLDEGADDDLPPMVDWDREEEVRHGIGPIHCGRSSAAA